MSTHGDELSSIDFESLIGGPLSAVIRAQAQAAVTTVDFIKSIGFTEIDGDGGTSLRPTNISFTAIKTVLGDGADGTVEETHKLTVPLLTIVPIPFIRIEDATIEFNAKITSTEYYDRTKSFGTDISASLNSGFLIGSAKFKATASYKRTTRNGNNINRSYSMNVKVKAVQDTMPEGMEKILSFLTDNATSES